MDFRKNLSELFSSTFNEPVEKIEDVRADGSNRAIIRLISSKRSVIGVWGPDKKENRAFVEFSKHFRNLSFPVPQIYAFDEKRQIYLETDLGRKTLYDVIKEERKGNNFPHSLKILYKKALWWLSKFQIDGINGFDIDMCYPRKEFDEQSMMWDCNYFKYYFLKLGGINFDEQMLEDDFKRLVGFISSANRDFFLYRDFQSRNIMVNNGELSFIDYQGGRRGYVAYDVASLLFDSKADIPPDVREELVEYYLQLDAVRRHIDEAEFRRYYYLFVVIRLMQAMGAYGLRGFYEKKTHFLTSIPYVIKNLEWLLENVDFDIKLNELKKVFKRITLSPYLRGFSDGNSQLNLRIYSFSYTKSFPPDPSGHGGGFVFDVRCLPNPGRNPEHSLLDGRDKKIKEYLDNIAEVNEYYTHVKKLIEQAISNYQSRGFKELYVAFGCTGGRHRSVYMAERLLQDFSQKKDVICHIRHLELEEVEKR